MYFRIQNTLLVIGMAVCREIVYHGTGSKYMCATKQEIPRQKTAGSGKVHDNRGMGMAEIIMVSAVPIVLTLIFRKQLVELVTWLYR